MDEIKALNLTEEDFTQKGKKLCFKGMYRKMIIKPSNVSSSIISHCNAKDEVQTPFYING
jgi:tRNA(Glu) U13 pseudouridine synthase TruD